METLPQSVGKIIKVLQDTQEKIENKALVAIAKNAGISKKDFLQYAKFDHCITQSYGRNTLFQGKNFGIYIMSWSPGDFTAIHSHGYSEWGFVYFFGNADHRTYSVNKKKLELRTSEIIKTGTIEPVCGNLVHAMGNLSDLPFITLHIYGSNNYEGTVTEDSKVYEIEKNRIRTTSGPAFINISDDFCKKDEHGIITDDSTRRDFITISSPFYKRNKIDLFGDVNENNL